MRQEQDTAKLITAVLDRGVSSLDNATVKRLETARNAAVGAMRAQVAEAEPVYAGVGKYIADHLHGQRLWTSMLVLLGLALVVFVLLQATQQTRGPLETDTLLLASDLPPEAYVDKRFDTWLKQSSRY